MLELSHKLTFFDSEGDLKRFCGLEFEIAGYSPKRKEQLLEVLKKWKCNIVRDGSIEQECIMPKTHKDLNDDPCVDHNYAFELRTSPARGEQFDQQIREICSALKAAKARVNDSCGLHVHVDARDLTPNGLMNLCYLWGKIEAGMFKLVDASRQGNHYCQKWGPKGLLEDIGHKDTTLDIYDELKMKVSDSGRYMSLNFLALEDHGTIENRMMGGPNYLDANKIIKWSKLNAKMLDVAQNYSLKEIKKIRSLRVINKAVL